MPPPLYEPIAGKIETVFVTRGVVEDLIILPGITRAPTLAARLETGSGDIGAIYAFPGDIVTQGQVLARLDTPDLDDEIKKLEESIELAGALHSLYLEEISTQIRLFGSAGSNDPQTRMLRLDRQYAITRHELEMADLETKLDVLLIERKQSEIFAPADGEVIYTIQLGASVDAMDAVMYIAGQGNLFVEHIGEPHVSWDVGFLQGEIGNRTYDLRLKRHSLSENMWFHKFGIEPPVQFEIRSGSLDLPGIGEPVFIRHYSARVEDALRIPEYAIYSDGDGANFVYRIRNGEQEIVHVTIGVFTDIFVQILEGLNEGDEIVVRQ